MTRGGAGMTYLRRAKPRRQRADAGARRLRRAGRRRYRESRRWRWPCARAPACTRPWCSRTRRPAWSWARSAPRRPARPKFLTCYPPRSPRPEEFRDPQHDGVRPRRARTRERQLRHRVRSVNHRYLDAKLRLPRPMQPSRAELRARDPEALLARQAGSLGHGAGDARRGRQASRSISRPRAVMSRPLASSKRTATSREESTWGRCSGVLCVDTTASSGINAES